MHSPPFSSLQRPTAAQSRAKRSPRFGCKRIDFDGINRAALRVLPALLRRWLPDGQVRGNEFIALNPHRGDRHLGSFKINLSTGRWADFATEARGGDVVSLAAYLFRLRQSAAARLLASMLGVQDAG